MSKTSKKYDHSQLPYWVFTIALVIIAILPTLIQDGMFIDGTQYAAVSKNMANGLGTFWAPYLNQNWYQNLHAMGSNVFRENPPLVHGIQVLFFKVFGDSLYTERIYGLCAALTAMFLVVKIWKVITRNQKEARKLSWLPVLIWLSMPIMFRSYQMNLMENTMGIFILASVYFVLKGLENRGQTYLYIVLGGISIFLAVFCKGPTGLFPLVAVGVYWLSGGKMKFTKVFVLTLILLLVPVLLALLILINDNALESLTFYYSRVLERVNNLPVANSHLQIVFRLFLDLLPALVVSAIIFFTQRKKFKFWKRPEGINYTLFFLLMGLAGSIPLTLTLVQRDFYLGPSLPFFALAFAFFVSPYVVNAMKQFSQKTQVFNLFRVLSISLLLGGLIFTASKVGKAGRDQEMLHDTYLFGEIIEKGTRVHLVESEEEQWRFELYLTRYCEISLGAPIEDTRYVLRSLNDAPPDNKHFELLPLDTRAYQLYEAK